MKTIINICVFSLLMGGLLNAQRHDDKRSEKIENLKIAYFTDNLDLTSEEAKAFWPLYNEYDKKLKELRSVRKEMFNSPDLADDAAAIAMLEKYYSNEENELDIRKYYLAELSEIISPIKVVKMMSLDHDFKRELLNKMKSKRPK